MNVKLFAILVLLAAIGSVIANVGAEVDVDEYFENVRGQLLQFYTSELISHAAIILGLIVGLPTVGSIIWNWKWLKRRHPFWRHSVRAFVFLITVTSVLFSFGRFVYWSKLGTPLIHVTREDVSDFLTESNATSWELNVTSCMSVLSDYAYAKLPKDLSPTSVLIQISFHLTNPDAEFQALIILGVASFCYATVRLCDDRRHDP